MAEALMLAALLGRDPHSVDAVWQAGGLDAVAVVECESHFNERALRREPRGHTSWGLFQIDDEFHPQYRDDLLLHIVEGVRFLNECKEKTDGGQDSSLYRTARKEQVYQRQGRGWLYGSYPDFPERFYLWRL